ncbi:sigma-54-dependent Fis family transcriptional regulator [Acidihalobacter yilgarnensis]|uniref:Sigma-54-dependent Fis family transcriptional regulator n=1 Tax=Acidihalobacter yilgarnensis TaxID=2819280 RepID=A0A1D8IT86_9GAMM|nr:sigma-54 dependent transcriptional regulator [Acidihalobacter yilgarnensis]AOU99699.1 sigma-54-dependent Fis family transcriptional regulator [Acidihalobacter yilgarnensis]
MTHTLKVLVVEDDLNLREAVVETLLLAGFDVAAAGDGREALVKLSDEPIGVVISDVQMSGLDGHALLRRIRQLRPDIPVVLMTAYGTIQRAVDAMRDGAADYLVKPFEASVLVEMVSRLMPVPTTNEGEPVAEDPRTRELLALAGRVAVAEATVMITGPSGSGKEVFAREIHRLSPRSGGPFIAINCAAIPENMLEAMLFGYEKGAYTGAHEARAGKFEQANGGTLLLDEISEMDLALQSKLLRVLQEREVERLGGHRLIPLDVRVLATSNRNLREEVATGRFREDLFYRLNVFPLHLPPLRERPRDILPLASRLLRRHTGRNPNLTPAAEHRLLAHDWPGNVRELDNVIQRALILSNGSCIDQGDLHFEALESGAAMMSMRDEPEVPADGGVLDADLRRREGELILETLRAVNGNRKEVAARLGISPRTLRYKLAKLRDAGVAIPC